MNQLYSINEIVLRQATTYVEHNGEYKVVGVISAEEMKKLHPFMRVVDGWYYELEGLAIDLTEHIGGNICNHSLESFLRKIHKPSTQSFLRKIHKPSTQSFTELMSVLKSPNKVWERV